MGHTGAEEARDCRAGCWTRGGALTRAGQRKGVGGREGESGRRAAEQSQGPRKPECAGV